LHDGNISSPKSQTVRNWIKTLILNCTVHKKTGPAARRELSEEVGEEGITMNRACKLMSLPAGTSLRPAYYHRSAFTIFFAVFYWKILPR